MTSPEAIRRAEQDLRRAAPARPVMQAGGAAVVLGPAAPSRSGRAIDTVLLLMCLGVFAVVVLVGLGV